MARERSIDSVSQEEKTEILMKYARGTSKKKLAKDHNLSIGNIVSLINRDAKNPTGSIVYLYKDTPTEQSTTEVPEVEEETKVKMSEEVMGSNTKVKHYNRVQNFNGRYDKQLILERISCIEAIRNNDSLDNYSARTIELARVFESRKPFSKKTKKLYKDISIIKEIAKALGEMSFVNLCEAMGAEETAVRPIFTLLNRKEDTTEDNTSESEPVAEEKPITIEVATNEVKEKEESPIDRPEAESDNQSSIDSATDDDDIFILCKDETDIITCGMIDRRHRLPGRIYKFIFEDAIPANREYDFNWMNQHVAEFVDRNIDFVEGKATKSIIMYVTGKQSVLGAICRVCAQKKINLTNMIFNDTAGKYEVQPIFTCFPVASSRWTNLIGKANILYGYGNQKAIETLDIHKPFFGISRVYRSASDFGTNTKIDKQYLYICESQEAQMRLLSKLTAEIMQQSEYKQDLYMNRYCSSPDGAINTTGNLGVIRNYIYVK